MNQFPESLVDNIDYKVNLKIEKFHTQDAFDQKVPDEVLNLPGNVLTNKGINFIWKAVAGAPFINTGVDGRYEWCFDHDHAWIGVGNIDGSDTPPSSSLQPTASDTKLYAEEHYDPSIAQQPTTAGRQTSHYCYMGMNTAYPISGDNQKIVFPSTFLPGVACFNWFEWCIANGNGNQTQEDMGNDQYIARSGAWGTAQGNDIDDVAPDPPVTPGVSYVGNSEADREKKTLLNHRYESMGRKYASATWIITVEVSLS